MYSAALLTDKNVADAVLLKQLVVYRENGAAGISEYIRDALITSAWIRIFAPDISSYAIISSCLVEACLGKPAAMLARKRPGMGQAGQRPGR